jgi:hypothetical protein
MPPEQRGPPEIVFIRLRFARSNKRGALPRTLGFFEA